MANQLQLYELLAPFFLAGFRFTDEVDSFLSFLAVDELHMASDEAGVVYVGRAQFVEREGNTASRRFAAPNNSVLEWDDIFLGFRLTIPRDGSPALAEAIDAALALPGGSAVAPLDTLFDAFGAPDPAPNEYPGLRFRLELLLSVLTFNLGDDWRPGMVDPATRRVVPDTDQQAGRSVRFVLPKMVFAFEQGDDLSTPPTFRLKSWGAGAFDAPTDTEQGEIVRMEPPLALHTSGRYAFGVDQVLIDLSQEHTPPEILQQFGVDEAFEGLFIKSIRFYYTDEQKEAGFGIAVNDALISFAGEVSLEAALDIFTSSPDLAIGVTFYVNGERLIFSRETSATGATRDLPLLENDDHNVVHVAISNGFPPYTRTVELRPVGGGAAITLSESSGRPGEWTITRPPDLTQPVGEYNLYIQIRDAGTPVKTVERTIRLNLQGAVGDAAAAGPDGVPEDNENSVPPADYAGPAEGSVPPGYRITHEGRGQGTNERLRITGGPAEVTVDGRPVTVDAQGLALIDVPVGQTVPVTITAPATAGATGLIFAGNVEFIVDRPLDNEEANYIALNPGPVQRGSRSYGEDIWFLHDIQHLLAWVQANHVIRVTLTAHASFESDGNFQSDLLLSERRMNVVAAILRRTFSSLTIIADPSAATGHKEARDASPRRIGHQKDRVVRVTGNAAGRPARSTTVSFTRQPENSSGTPGGGTPAPREPGDRRAPPTPPAPPERAPTWLRRLSFRVRLERNTPVLFELSGQIDFDTELEAYGRGVLDDDDPTYNVPREHRDESTSLALRNRPGASASPDDGVVDFVLNVTYDTSTYLLAETLTVGAAPGDRDGLLEGVYDVTRTDGFWADVVGALLIFAPVINQAADSIDDRDAAGDITALTVSIALPVTVAALRIFRTKRLTLYGFEVRTRQYLPQNPEESLQPTDAGVIIDYGVEFVITLASLGITWEAPIKVRYKAVGFQILFQQPDNYQPIFDTSKGYEIELTDSGRASLPPPLDQLLNVFSARIARLNPLIFELDIGMKANLGIITVDRFKVRVPLEEPLQISVQAAGVRVEIPSTLSGSGYVAIVDTEKDGVKRKGFEGTVDITLIPMKLRIAASLAVVAMEDRDGVVDRRAVAVYLGLTVEFPAPILLGQTGLGIFGFSGLFAMHYRRTEDPAAPGAATGPALNWLIKARGEPAQLAIGTGDGRIVLWEGAIDRWSFGVAILLGTVEGGFLLNFRGMFVLELPGPRILIFVKIQIVAVLPSLSPAGSELTVGMLGVIDLDFNLGQITVGVVVDLRVESLFQVTIPIEIFFSLRDPSNWHLYVGTIDQPITAMLLNFVRGTGYFMVAGNGILNFRLPDGTPRPLPGLAVAVGLGVAIVFGDESIGLYLKVAASADMGVSFLPERLFIAGGIQIVGELRLFIVSIAANGLLTVEAPDPTVIHGEICGKISLFFFTIEGCVTVTIGAGKPVFPAPDLVRKVFLQSFAPVVLTGQGGDRPIDGSLGDANTVLSLNADGSRTIRTGEGEITLPASGVLASAGDRAKALTVPIDSVIVAQFGVIPQVNLPEATGYFTTDPGTPPSTPDGWVSLGNERFVRYRLSDVALTPVVNSPERPPAVWRREHFPTPPEPPSSPPSQGADTQISLALMSRVPVAGAWAVERSTDLERQIPRRWSGVCAPVAPPACVLWTFCGQPLGPSGGGWSLETGVPEPDPPGTRRHAPPPTRLVVEEPAFSVQAELAGLLTVISGTRFGIPAQIVGYNPVPKIEEEQPEQPSTKELDFADLSPGRHRNPLELGGLRFRVDRRQVIDLRDNRVLRVKSFQGLDLGAVMQIDLPVSSAVELLVLGDRQFRVRGFDRAGALVAEQNVQGGDEPLSITLQAMSITRVEVINGQGALPSGPVPPLLLRLTFTAERRSGQPEAPISPEVIRCMRALQLPVVGEQWAPERQLESSLAENILQVWEEELGQRWVRFHTGPAESVALLIAARQSDLSSLVVRELAADGVVVADHSLASLAVAPVGNLADLPPAWHDPDRPWRREVEPVLALLARPPYGALLRRLVTLRPSEACAIVELRLPQHHVGDGLPGVLVGAVMVCPLVERRRAEHEAAVRNTELQTIRDYLNGKDTVPLLRPDTDYVLSISYEAQIREGATEHPPEFKLQEFFFRTDAAPPARLDPYVLGTTPSDDESFHFFDDPVKLLFNDLSLVQLYATYGRRLRAVIRSADGRPVDMVELATGERRPGHHALIAALSPVLGAFHSPYRDMLAAAVAGGIVLPCSDEIGATGEVNHGSYTLPVDLRPLMTYTLEVELIDREPGGPPPPAPPPDTPVTPLFRRRFTTSRFASLDALAKAMQVQRAQHRALRGPIALRGAPSLGLPGVEATTDEQIQDSLRAAGEQALPAAAEPGLTIYWARRPGETRFTPHAVMLDAPEPLWRWRVEPELRVVPNQDDPNFKLVAPTRVPALHIVEQGAAVVARFVHSTGGTRTLLFFAAGFVGGTLRLAFSRPASALFELPALSQPLLELTFGAAAPWEEDADA